MNARLTLDERSELDHLRRLTVDQAEQLQALRAYHGSWAPGRAEDLKRRFGVSPAEALVLAELLDESPKPVSKERLLAATEPSWQDRNKEPQIKIVDVHIARIRRVLEGLGYPKTISTLWGFGYFISADAAASLRPSEQVAA